MFSDKWFLGAGASYETDPVIATKLIEFSSYLSGRDNLFAMSSTGLRYEVGGDLFYLTMSLNADYERDPPPGVKKNDSTWVLGSGFEL